MLNRKIKLILIAVLVAASGYAILAEYYPRTFLPKVPKEKPQEVCDRPLIIKIDDVPIQVPRGLEGVTVSMKDKREFSENSRVACNLSVLNNVRQVRFGSFVAYAFFEGPTMESLIHEKVEVLKKEGKGERLGNGLTRYYGPYDYYYEFPQEKSYAWQDKPIIGYCPPYYDPNSLINVAVCRVTYRHKSGLKIRYLFGQKSVEPDFLGSDTRYREALEQKILAAEFLIHSNPDLYR